MRSKISHEDRPRAQGDDIYLLVHVDDYEFEDDPETINPGASEWSLDDLRSFLAAYGREVRAAAGAARRIAVTDFLDEDEELLLGGAPLKGWEMINLGATELEQLTPLLTGAKRVIIAGFARHDCVAQVVRIAQRAGCEVVLHNDAVLPLDAAARRSWDLQLGW